MVFMIWKMYSYAESLWFIILWPIIFTLCMGVLLYIFLYKREWLAKWIVGNDELAPPKAGLIQSRATPWPASQIQWLPVAFRLVCVTAGLYCLFTVGWNKSFNLIRYHMFKPEAAREGYKALYTAKFLSIELIIRWLIMLAIGIYLVCGAPHFVRWHVKRTLEFAIGGPNKIKPENNPS
jgi:hypothetical protein